MKQGRNTAGTLTITGGDTARTGRYVSQAEKAAVRAEQSAAVAEAWAVGEKGGAPVGSTDETFHNNARHFAEQAAASVTFAQAARTAAESAKDDAEAAADSVTGSAAQIQSNKQDVHDLKSALKTISYTFADMQTYNGYINKNGIFVANSDWRCTDYLRTPNSNIYLKAKFSGIATNNYYIHCYDGNKNRLGGIIAGRGNTVIDADGLYQLINNTYYIRITILGADVDTFEIVNIYTETDLRAVNEAISLYRYLGFAAFDKFASIGDSLSVGFYTDSAGTEHYDDKLHSWGGYIEKIVGTTAHWTGKSGATSKSWLEESSNTWGVNYCTALGEMPLYIYCMGANEGSLPLGSIEDIGTDNPTTVYGYVDKVIRILRTISPNSVIVCTGVMREQSSAQNINRAYRDVSALYDKCFYIDMQPFFNSVMHSYYRNYHYTATGYCVVASKLDAEIRQIMQDNLQDFLDIV